MSKRQGASCCRDGLGVAGAVGESGRLEQRVPPAVAPAVEDALLSVQPHDTTVDEPSWREHNQRRWVWAVVTAQGRVLAVATSRGAAVLEALVGEL